jgi:hypothetical protein
MDRAEEEYKDYEEMKKMGKVDKEMGIIFLGRNKKRQEERLKAIKNQKEREKEREEEKERFVYLFLIYLVCLTEKFRERKRRKKKKKN